MDKNTWKTFIANEDDEKDIEKLRKQTLTGRPLCNDQIIENLENTLGRRLVALPEGRPRKIEE